MLIHDDVCKAKTYYVANNRSLKVLVRMAWGLRNEVDGSPLFDETAEPWKDLKQKEWKSDNRELGLEIRRRWEDYIKPTSTDPAISALGNDFTTQDADCSFIRAAMARCRLTLIGTAAGRAAEQSALQYNWTGPDPIVCLFHCIIDKPDIRSKFMLRLNSMTSEALENCNSFGSREISVWEDVAVEWNDTGYTVTTESFDRCIHPDLILSRDIPHSSVARLANATAEKCESKFNSTVLYLNRVIQNWEASGQDEGGHIEGRHEFGCLEGREDNALATMANFVPEQDVHFLYIWALIDKYQLLKTCMQVNVQEFAAGNGADGVHRLFDSGRFEARQTDDEDDGVLWRGSKQQRSGGVVQQQRLHDNEMKAQRKKDRLFQKRQSLEKTSLSRKDKRTYLCQLGEREESGVGKVEQVMRAQLLERCNGQSYGRN
ncbi:hypothetical protein ACHAWO_010082 [Cyclotella atomus]|uniref:Uncharacterized protein n=1 Tax=Cyclotella atomus TaxID=382360 RepID=A0ABD3Q293_9STRA